MGIVCESEGPDDGWVANLDALLQGETGADLPSGATDGVAGNCTREDDDPLSISSSIFTPDPLPLEQLPVYELRLKRGTNPNDVRAAVREMVGTAAVFIRYGEREEVNERTLYVCFDGYSATTVRSRINEISGIESICQLVPRIEYKIFLRPDADSKEIRKQIFEIAPRASYESFSENRMRYLFNPEDEESEGLLRAAIDSNRLKDVEEVKRIGLTPAYVTEYIFSLDNETETNPELGYYIFELVDDVDPSMVRQQLKDIASVKYLAWKHGGVNVSQLADANVGKNNSLDVTMHPEAENLIRTAISSGKLSCIAKFTKVSAEDGQLYLLS